MSNEPRISKSDLIRIYNTMVFYKRIDGFMGFAPDGVLRFFDSNPDFDDIVACPITIDEVKVFIDEYDTINS